MKNSFVILTDSTSNLPVKYVKKYDIRILPLKYLAEDKEFPGYEEDGEENFRKLYAYLRAGRQVSTSMVNQEEAYEMGKAILETGNDVLYIGLSSKLSGTCHAVRQAFDRLKGEYPEHSLYVVDSLCVALGEGLLVYTAVKMRKQGKGIKEIYEWCNKSRWKINTLFTVDDLNHLRRSGRASSIVAVAGSILRIKPLLRMSNGGVLTQEGKVRGRKKSLDELARRTLEEISEPQMVFISHGDCCEDARYLAEQLYESNKVRKIVINMLDPVLGVHTGPGAIGIFFI